MNILIVSYYFYPELTPRAFRAFELVKEFCEQGHSVRLIIPNKECYILEKYNHKNLTVFCVGEKKEGREMLKDQHLENHSLNPTITKKPIYKKILPNFIKTRIKNYREWHYNYFNIIRNKPFIRSIINFLKNDKTSYDLIISIGLPVESHIGTAISLFKYKNLRSATTIADYGDPFSKQKNVFWGYQVVDFFIAKMFDYVLVPTQNAKKSYSTFKKENKIKIIPQAFDLTKYKILEYTPNPVPTFAYAGCFYSKIRNPSALFDYLTKNYTNYKFVLYTVYGNFDTVEILKVYKDIFKDKLIIKHNVERSALITELSTMDFLLNFENITVNQTPSKLIDYAISERPICSISTANFEPTIFDEFMLGNYSNRTKINLEEYDIKKVVDQFLDLGIKNN